MSTGDTAGSEADSDTAPYSGILLNETGIESVGILPTECE
jgi:hypothetical protein